MGIAIPHEYRYDSKGDRNDIETEVKLIDEEETNFNEELAAIAGSKLLMWIKDLLTSKNII